jgi:hypothetical protein
LAWISAIMAQRIYCNTIPAFLLDVYGGSLVVPSP